MDLVSNARTRVGISNSLFKLSLSGFLSECTFVRTYVGCMYVYVYLYVCVFVFVFLYVCVHVSECVDMYVRTTVIA